jgi:hypothetical protein
MHKQAAAAAEPSNDLRRVQIALKASGFYSGTIDGTPDFGLAAGLEKALAAIKAKMPGDTEATSFSMTVDQDGKVTGDVSKLEKFISMLLQKKEESPLAKVFSKTPFGKFDITDEASLNKAIDAVRNGISSTFPEDKRKGIVDAFNAAVEAKDANEIKSALDVISLWMSKKQEAVTKVEAIFLSEFHRKIG